MIYIDLPEKQTRLLPFYLAMEEYVARYLPIESAFFMWQVEPTVIFGRNQVVENEVNLEYCQQHNIRTYRRKSGGGCVYADMSNVMLSVITREGNIKEIFAEYLSLLAKALQSIGIDARQNDHNDIMLDGRKISGNAIYHLPGRTIAHGTLLYDTDMENMLHAITPPQEKLARNGVKSVRQRVALLKDYTSLSLDEIKAGLRRGICNKTVTLSPVDVEKIEEMAKEYEASEFIFSK